MNMSNPIKKIDAGPLNIGYFHTGPKTGKTAVLLHGWPDDALTWNKIIPALHQAGWETIVPYLRGYGPTRFLDKQTFRSGQLSALGQDIINFINALQLEQCALIGHDWGARAAYITSCIIPERISHCIALSVGWGTNTPDQRMSLHQIQNYWYQWYMSMEHGENLLRQKWPEFTRHIWKIWNPNWNFPDDEFNETAKSFENPDWCEIVLHSYRVRWGLAQTDPTYNNLEEQLKNTPNISVPTLVIHGGGDPCNAPSTSEGKEHLFSGPYERVVIDGAGHFPQREAPQAVTKELVSFLSTRK